ncbi:MAG: hypothetical protein JEZ03_05935, partial [Bacteroidales bacterium]|nr:hypothetical protein [Bacteroidales bacterium]
PDEAYPKEKITTIENTLVEIESSYQTAIKQGDALFAERKFEESKASFETALTIKATEEYPGKKIKEIEEVLAGLAQAEQSYQETIASADQLWESKTWTEAKTAYEKALQFKPDEAYPKEKITTIENTLVEIESSYQIAITQGDALFAERKFEESKASFETALTIKATEEYPENKIKEIEELIAGLAKADESYANAITIADALFAEEKWDEAKVEYKKAIQFKGNEVYPKEQIVVIDLKLEARAAALTADQEYTSAILLGNQLFEVKNYSEARLAYQKAVSIKANEPIPANKILEIDALLLAEVEKQSNFDRAIHIADSAFSAESFNKALSFYNQAIHIIPDNPYALNQIEAIKSKLDQMDADSKAFNDHLAKGDQLLEAKQYQDAISEYKQAQHLNESDPYTQEQIDKVNIILLALAKEQQVFNEKVDKGDSLFAVYQYTLAIDVYNEALLLRPDDEALKQQISKVDDVIKDEASKLELYEGAIQKGDYFFGQQKLFKAKEHFENAKSIRPLEEYPVAKIYEIEGLLRERQREFNIHIARADSLFSSGMLKEAKASFEKASRIKNDDEYVKTRLKDVNRLLQDQFIKMMEEYGDAIRLADSYMSTRSFDEAIPAYQLAAWINPGEQYPINKIKEIRDYMTAHEFLDLVQDSIVLHHDQNKRFTFKTIPAPNKKNNYILIKASRLEDDHAKIFVSYGQDGRKNGGFVLKELPTDNPKEFIFRVSNHSRWISEDNNYIDVYSQGGSVKIVTLQLSRGD